MTIKTGIYGASGYTGLELIKLINHHPEFEVSFAASDSYAGQVYEGIPFVSVDKTDMSKVDVIFLCTPHGASATLAKQALDAGAKVVDLSADLRLNTPDSYKKWYDHDHPVPDLLPTVYGLPELNREKIVGQKVIANPGCYPTTTILGLAPALKAGAVQDDATLIVDAKSGVTGAGRKAKVDMLFAEVYGDFRPYNIGRVHRHVGEIEQELKAINPSVGQLIFSPHLLPIDRGLLATSYLPLKSGWDLAKVHALYEDAYCDEPLVNFLPQGQIARIADVARTNGAVVSLHPATENTIIVVSALDNLLKGASSQAVQNANLICDLPETMGLL